MKVDYGLILAAGFGTRMGDEGRRLPKPLWPIFEENLISLQVEYFEWLGIKNIYINVHYFSDEISLFIKELMLKKKVNIKVLFEKDLLDIGGAIHNLANQKEVSYKGNLLINNGDQFLFFPKEDLAKSVEELVQREIILFATTVSAKSKHNKIVLDDENKLHEIVSFNNNIFDPEGLGVQNNYLTYSGMSLIDLEKLPQLTGKLNFFDSVATFKTRSVYVRPIKTIEYWDFGTKERYHKMILKMLTEYNQLGSSAGPFIHFCEQRGVFRPESFSQDHTQYDTDILHVDTKQQKVELNLEELNLRAHGR